MGRKLSLLKATTIAVVSSVPNAVWADNVTLQSTDGTLKFSGDLLEFNDGKYILQTNLGKIAIGAEGVTCEGSGCPSTAPETQTSTANAAQAEFKSGPVSLQSFDGALKFEGQLIAIQDGNYVLRTQLGDVKIAANTVTCVGDSCPSVDVESLVEADQGQSTESTEPDDPRVVLTSFDGNVQFEGDLVEVKNGKYILNTKIGEMRILVSSVECKGPTCPTVGSEIIQVAEDSTEAQAPIEIDFTISGSDLIGTTIMPQLVSGYAATKDAALKVTTNDDGSIASLVADNGNGDMLGSYLIAPQTTSAAIKALESGQSQIAMTTRKATIVEQRSIAGLQEHLIALDNLVIVTHPNNTVDQISVDDLRRIYSGQITNWSKLGGPDAPIMVVAHPAESDTRKFFDARLFGADDTTSRAKQTAGQTDADVVEMVKSNPLAIGYVSYAFKDDAKPVSLVSSCGIQSTPDAFSAKTDEYLLGRRLFLYNTSEVSADAQKLIDFSISEDADVLIARSGFVNLDVARRVQSASDPRFAGLSGNQPSGAERLAVSEMLTAIGQNDRLSTTFRFGAGSSRLDEKALKEMPRLIKYLSDLPKGTEITLVGFADSIGAFERNRDLSVSRANQARAALQNAASAGQLNHLKIKAIGFGELTPASCNDTEDGRALNRRVEIWVAK